MTDTLSKWEDEAKRAPKNESLYEDPNDKFAIVMCQRLLALISIIRQKDFVLEEINHQAHAHEGSLNYKWLQDQSEQALALTAKLESK